MPRYICNGCKSYFFADEEKEDFTIGEQFFCSYCYPKVRICGVCGKLKVFKREIKTAIGICDKCKKTTQSFPNAWLTLRFITFKRDEFKCRYCGRSPLQDKEVKLHCEHITPKVKGGQNILDNLVTSCGECNIGKLDVLLEQYQIDLIKNRK